ncbi:MAG: DUF1385 domain-containing protein [Deltaproteobacteria bacterium HGW-Deltaproteobacteria-22]|nr:MAG: DUF1385 domain-containing protein [Deltaproteobacteria bacterium HGW-Deltaproteobacteria-22]
MKPDPKGPSCIAVGGQAVMEGVMMRSAHSFAVACRIPTGEILIKEQKWQSVWDRMRFLRWPFFRGIVTLGEALVNGFSALTWSANMQIRHTPAGPDGKKEEELSGGGAALAITISLLFAMGLFVALPHFATMLLGLDASSLSFHLVDGVIKLVVLLAYMGAIGFLPDIKRVFAYHGAEHKSIFAHEAGLPLTVENARKFTRFHPRCGTSFLFLVLAISIIVFSLTLQFRILPWGWADNLLKVFIKIPMMLPVAGIAYELIRLSGKYHSNPLLRPVIWPGLWLQRLTTREPDDAMLEVALASLRRTLWREAHLDDPSTTEGVLFKDLSEVPEA